MTSRLIGWEGKLSVYLEARRVMPFVWGKHDCCRFACNGLVVQGLPDPMADVRLYKTARGAVMAIKSLGSSLDEAATALARKAGLYEINPSFAGRGCVVLADVETPEGSIEPALGLVGLSGTLAEFAGGTGLVWRRLIDCQRAWGFN